MMAWLVAAAVVGASPLTLDEVKAAARQNLDAVKAELDVRRAGSNRTVARSSILPQVAVTAGVSDTLIGPQRRISTVPVLDSSGNVTYAQQVVETPGFNQGSFSLGLSVSQLLYDGGRWWNQIAQAGAQEEAALGQLDEQRLVSELEAVRRFYELVRAQLTLKVLESSVARDRDQLSRAEALFAAGRGQRRDVLDAQVNLGNDAISVLRQKQAIASAQVDLLQWLGRPVDDVEAVVPDVMDAARTPVGAPDAAKALEAARAHRPLLKAFTARVRSSELAIDLARADYFPTISLSAQLGRSSPAADPFFTDPTRQNYVSLGANLSWNVFSGFATVGREESARADLTQVQAQQKQTLVELEGEVKRSLVTLATQVEIASLSATNRGLSQTELKGEEERFNAGAGSSIDVRNAQVKLTQAELSQLTGRIDVEIARAGLTRLVGAPVEGQP
jgi:outer membrane protein TolC